MKIENLKIAMEKDDTADIRIPKLDVAIGISASGSITICNCEEERIYHLHKTKHGGFKLKEGTLI